MSRTKKDEYCVFSSYAPRLTHTNTGHESEKAIACRKKRARMRRERRGQLVRAARGLAMCTHCNRLPALSVNLGKWNGWDTGVPLKACWGTLPSLWSLQPHLALTINLTRSTYVGHWCDWFLLSVLDKRSKALKGKISAFWNGWGVKKTIIAFQNKLYEFWIKTDTWFSDSVRYSGNIK